MKNDKSKKENVNKQTNSNRRSFIRTAGAAVTAGLATTVPAMAKTNNNDKGLKLKLVRLEGEKAIRELHRNYENLLNSGSYEQITDLFVNDAEVIFNENNYRGRDSGISRLYCEKFKAGLTGKKMEPARDIQVDEDVIKVSEDGNTATARFSYSIQVGEPMEEDNSLVQMARLHGEGIYKSWEGGVYEVEYVKDRIDGNWKIARLEHRALAKGG